MVALQKSASLSSQTFTVFASLLSFQSSSFSIYNSLQFFAFLPTSHVCRVTTALFPILNLIHIILAISKCGIAGPYLRSYWNEHIKYVATKDVYMSIGKNRDMNMGKRTSKNLPKYILIIFQRCYP